MRLGVATPDFAAFRAELARQLRAEFTGALRQVTRQTEKELEALTARAGLGLRLARTWQSAVYPTQGDSLRPAAEIWSTAPGPMRAFTMGATIRGKDGGFLAIPTEEVARVRGVSLAGARNKRITPGGFERATGIKLRLLKGLGGIGFLIGERAGNRSGRVGRAAFRPLSAARLRRGGRPETFLAFVLVPQVTIARRFDIAAVHRAWQRAAQRALGPAAARAIGRAQLAAAGLSAAPRPRS